MKKTKPRYEMHLNAMYQDMSFEEVFSQFEYLTNKNRKGNTTKNAMHRLYQQGRIGTLIRRLDPIAFETGYNDYNR